MTNYNEKLDEVLRNHRGRVLTYHELYRKQHHNPHRLDEDLAHADAVAKQAITSLTKELVAEAKPLLKEKTASTEFTTWDRKTKIVKTFESETDPGFNKAIKEFEQNLLKALEEK